MLLVPQIEIKLIFFFIPLQDFLIQSFLITVGLVLLPTNTHFGSRFPFFNLGPFFCHDLVHMHVEHTINASYFMLLRVGMVNPEFIGERENVS